MKRVALYYRVSTDEQTTEPQRLELRAYCERRGWTDVREYSDKISGAKTSKVGLDMLMADMRRGKLDVILCAKLDRLGRSLPHLAQLLAELDAHHVALICTSQAIDTSDENPCGKLTRGILAVVAEFELEMIKSRTRAGLAAARANGKTLGRPRFVMTPAKIGILEAWKTSPADERMSITDLAEALGCSRGKAHSLVKEAA